jgi:hypothetical protein
MSVLAGKSLGVVLAISLIVAGCASSSSSKDDQDWAREGSLVFSGGGGAGSNTGTGSSETEREGWGIVLEFFSGAGHVERARERRDQIARMIGRQDVFVRVRSKGSAVVLGSYPGPNDPAAHRDLERMQALVVNGQRPYARSYLAPPPPPPPDMGNVPELNLLSAKRLAGDRALYTLQVAVFESPQRDKAKRAAEQFAVQLRQQGDMAFYYHGPTRSMVTIGIFGEEAYNTQSQQVSLQVQSLQRRFPYNLMNGTDKIQEGTGTPQPSMLVQIPD